MADKNKVIDEKRIKSILGENYSEEEKEKLIKFIETHDVDFEKEFICMNAFGDWISM